MDTDDLMAEKQLIIFDTRGNVLELGRQNLKGHRKSIEQGVLWYVHPESGKVLPYPGDAKLETAKNRDTWFEAVIRTADSAGSDTGTTSGKDVSAESLPDLGILEQLTALLADRKKELPEGSYTTHLFSSGAEKIRKKTGEEAIELVLAKDRDEIVYEAADLVYHMMVLFAALDIPFNDVFAELAKRHK